MLHVSDNSIIDKEKISKCLESLQTTSPSSLLLASLDATTSKLRENPASIFDNAIKLAKEAKNTIQQIPGISVFESTCIDPLRVTVGFNDLGLSGYAVDDFIYRDQKVISELPGPHFITFPFAPQTGREHVDRLILAFRHLSSFTQHQVKKELKSGVDLEPWNVVSCMKLSPREAFFIRKRRVDIKDVVGKICGELICPFPPGIPIMTPGEVISEKVMHILLQSKANGAKIIGASDPLLSSLLICDI